MPDRKGKVVNDPVYGFIRFPEPEVMAVIEHPWFQRLRHIKQMGMAHLVYPGATHTRFHHSLGATHLMGLALDELKSKGVRFSEEECLAARLAILLHDVGHGPFSHALEHSLAAGVTHETLSRLIIRYLAGELGGALHKAGEVFSHSYPKKYLHGLVSSQLDVDRLDYLNRDSFYTGVSEGVIGYDRILHMLTVRDGELAVEEKAVHSVEKFIIARRLMYSQVYLHKTVLSAELLLISVMRRARELARQGVELFATPALRHFLYHYVALEDFEIDPRHLDLFCSLDDNDVLVSIKLWQSAPDRVLAELCRMVIRRRLYKVTFLEAQPDEDDLAQRRAAAARALGLRSEEEASYFVFSGTTTSSTYNMGDEHIRIAMKDGSVRNISTIANPLVTAEVARPVIKNYICALPV